MRRIVLLILDGWGIGRRDQSNPIHVAAPKTFAEIRARYLGGALQSSGIAVGLPWGEEGNSEVGHLTMGAGKVLYQHYPRITLSIRNGDFFRNSALLGATREVKAKASALHLVGLLTAANVHASLEHVRALLELARREGVEKVNLHLFSDGKDSPPKSVLPLLGQVRAFIREFGVGRIASLSGRFYAEDRDEHWNRTEKVFRVLVGDGPITDDLDAYVQGFFDRGLADEFIEPVLTGPDPQAIRAGDAVVFFDFREDSIRQLVSAFAVPDFRFFSRTLPRDLHLASMTNYAKEFRIPVAYPPEDITNPLGKILADEGRTQIRIAETEKYAHVTYFFNGYREQPFPNEYRVLVPSRNVPHHEQDPEMRNPDIAARVIESIEGRGFDLIVANFASPDTIAHTGNFDAAVATVQSIDREMKRILTAASEHDASVLITSDHAHIEMMVNPLTGVPETGHHTNLVPIYLIGAEFERPKSPAAIDMIEQEAIGLLADVAPTILELLGIQKPQGMTGQSLVPFLR